MYKFYPIPYDYKNNWFTIVPFLSFNKSKIFVLTDRNIGKTYGAKIWRILAGVKYGKQTLWIRCFKNEIDEVREDFINDDMLYSIGLNPGDFRLYGKWLFYKGKKIIQFAKLSDAVSLKGKDVPNMDTIVFDEFTQPIERQHLYRGDMGKHISSVYKSIRRIKKNFKMVFFGNKETVDNPIFHQFGLSPLNEEFEGVAVKGDSLIVQINTIPKCAEESKKYDEDDADIDFLQGGLTNGIDHTHIGFWENDATPMFGIDYLGYKVTVANWCGTLYIRNGYNPNALHYTDRDTTRVHARLMTGQSRTLIREYLAPFLTYNRIRYKDAQSYEAMKLIIDMARLK